MATPRKRTTRKSTIAPARAPAPEPAPAAELAAPQVAAPRVRNPRILIVTPEITYLPEGMGNMANKLSAKAGGLADVSASLVSALFELGADVHVALPHYRRMFHQDVSKFINEELKRFKATLQDERIHLAQDRAFFYRGDVYSPFEHDNRRIALAFQREVINHIVPQVQPDLIHCNDWMTGLVPAMCRRMGIPVLFTIHNIHTYEVTLAFCEDRGIDAAEFWDYLYYMRPPTSYDESRATNPVDLVNSGIFASHFINTVSPSFLQEIVDGYHDFIPWHIRNEVRNKAAANCARGILNSPDASYDPRTDKAIKMTYDERNATDAKRINKITFQKKVGLRVDPDAPLFFWPHRLDPVQKGPQLLTDILYRTVDQYRQQGLQIAVVANGAFKDIFHHVVGFHGMESSVAVCGFNESLSRLGYAASDFMLMPSLFEPCGLPQMISAMYGSLPVARNTGGLRDTVRHMNVSAGTGNGFVFETFDSGGLKWAIDQAMAFWSLPEDVRGTQVARVMTEARATFNHEVTAKQYIRIYEEMLQRPLVNPY